MTGCDLDLTQACEERIVNCWPAVDTLLIGDFVVRFANGYSGRANSASPIRPGADLTEEDIGIIEALFTRQGLKPCFRATPLMSPVLRARLDARGYRIKDSSFGMILPLAGLAFPADPSVTFSPEPPDFWLDGISRQQVPEKRSPEHLRMIVGRIRVPVLFANGEVEGRKAAFGMVAHDRGMAELASIMLEADIRGQGIGRRLTCTMLNKAIEMGAHSAFLQVACDNLIAKSLYLKLGFRDVYTYDTVVKAN